MNNEQKQNKELQQQKLLQIIPIDQDVGEDKLLRKQNFKSIAHKHFHTLSDVEKQRLFTYETLDYEIIENELQREANLKESHTHKKMVNLVMWLTFMLIGAATGTMAFCMNTLVQQINYFRWDSTRYYIDKGEKGFGMIIFIGLAICYTLVSAFLVNYISLPAAGSGIPEVKAYLNGCNQQGLLTFKTIIVKIVGVCFSVGAGLICGKEGPLVHTGSIFAALFSHLPKVGDIFGMKQFRNDHDKRDFVSGGAAAGVAAAFGAPIGGILFSLEEAASFWSTPLTCKVFICACFSTFFLNLCKGAFNYGSADMMDYPKDVIYGLIRQNGNTQTQNAFLLWQFPFMIILAIVGGLMGALFNQINKIITDFRFKYYIRIKLIRILEAVSIAILTAILFFWAPILNYKCFDIQPVDFNYNYPFDSPENSNSTFVLYNTDFVRYGCPQHQFNDLATLSVNTEEQVIKLFFHSHGPYRVSSLFIYQVISFIAAVLIYGASVPSGLFVPGILMGSAFGRLFGILLNYIGAQNPALYPSIADKLVDEGTWAWLGATAMLAGSSRITISLAVIMLETTGNFLYTIPTIVIVTVAKWIGDIFNISLYDIHIQKKNLPFVEPKPLEGQDQLQAEDLMSKPVDMFYEIEKIGFIFDTLMSSKHNGYPIVTNVLPEDINESFTPEQLENPRFRGKLRGVMLRNNIIIMLKHLIELGILEQQLDIKEQDVLNNQVNQIKRLKIDIFKTTMQSRVQDVHELEEEIIEMISKNRNKLIDFRPYMNPGPYVVYNQTKLSKVFRLYRSMGLRHLPVVNDANEVVGLLTRKELMTDFKQDLF